MSGKALLALAVAASLLGAAEPQPVTVAEVAPTPPWAQACKDWDEWDKPGPPFKIYGNTYYVGTCGIASILIVGDGGLAVIDSGTDAGADLVLANIRALGFDPKDVKLLLASHEHFDHVGGMAKLEAATGGQIVFSEVGSHVLAYGEDVKNYGAYGSVDFPVDPQAGMHEPMRRVSSSMPYTGKLAAELLARFAIKPLPTPGHTPGAMSWTWEACEDDGCLTVVYADSLSAISSDSYRFLDHEEYLAAFLKSFDTIAQARCDILLTPHPSGGNLNLTMWVLQRRKLDGMPDFFCRGYAQKQKEALTLRLAREAESK